MKKLCYETADSQNSGSLLLKNAPERVLQFGEGNFLRAFADAFIDEMNERAGFDGKVVVVQPIKAGLTDRINEQQGLYTLLLRGQEQSRIIDRRRIISCISRCIDPYINFTDFLTCAENPDLRFILSNTTEAGIAFDDTCRFDDAPPQSFPGKLTRFLYERFRLRGKGFILLPCELIDNNGRQLLHCVEQYISLWNLGDDFLHWVRTDNIFCSTLVDRIVTGYPSAEAAKLSNELGYEDALLDTAESFGLWVIEAPAAIEAEFPAAKAGLPVIITDDCGPYKQRKVRILNGAHTAMVPAAFLSGLDIVRSSMEDPLLHGFMEKAVYREIIPTLTLPEEELRSFAAAVTERFLNPTIDHKLLSICLNTCSKWRARILPSLLDYYEKFQKQPICLTFSFAAFLQLYRGCDERMDGGISGKRGEEPYILRDEAFVLDFFMENRGLPTDTFVKTAVENQRMWGNNLKKLPGFSDAVTAHLYRIEQQGIRQALEYCLSKGDA